MPISDVRKPAADLKRVCGVPRKPELLLGVLVWEAIRMSDGPCSCLWQVAGEPQGLRNFERLWKILGGSGSRNPAASRRPRPRLSAPEGVVGLRVL